MICHVADDLPEDSMVRVLLLDCISACRNYLYEDMVKSRYGDGWYPLKPSELEEFCRQFYRSSSESKLTKQQHQLLQIFKKTPRLVVSAPTSFGKTRLLQEIILDRHYNRIALIMPTIALIAETVRRFRQDKRFDDYAIVNTMSVPIGNARCIFVLTPEKLDLLLDDNEDLQFDFFAMDEIYKIQDDDDRKAVFANVLYRMSISGSDFYLIGPYFKHFSERFLRRTDSQFRHYSLEIVQKDEIRLQDYAEGDVFHIDGTPVKKARTDKTNLKRIVNALKDQRLIYQSTKRGTESTANELASYSNEERADSALVAYIKENVSEEWSLVQCLSKGVAFHHGSMPRYIQAELVDSFNRGEIQSLVCTTTMTEGVNTTAKNVIVYSNKKGEELLTGFDYKNIKGRAGRFLHHFIGRVITFYAVEEEEREVISFHYMDDNDLASDEVLCVNENDLLPDAQAKRSRVIALLEDHHVPSELIRKNKYITVEKQLALISRLRQDPELLHTLLFQGNIPSTPILDTILDIVREYLFSRKDYDDRNFTPGDLKRLVKFYVYRRPSLKELIATQNGATTDTRIRKTFYLISHYFEFSLPKYLSCFQNLFNFVVSESGESRQIPLGFTITMLQYGFTESHEIALKDAGLPDGLIAKVSPNLRECRSIEEIRLKIRITPEIFEILSPFEIDILKKSL